MKPSQEDVKILDQTVAHIRVLTERYGILTEKLNLDYYDFEVSKGRVQKGICLYYTEDPNKIQNSEHVWYTGKLLPISVQASTGQKSLQAYLKLFMGDSEDWYRDQHHLRMIGQANPSGFYGARLACNGEPYVIFFKMPRNTQLHRCSPQPIECYAQDSRLNLLFLLTTVSPDYQPRSLDLSYVIGDAS